VRARDHARRAHAYERAQFMAVASLLGASFQRNGSPVGPDKPVEGAAPGLRAPVRDDLGSVGR
jgi:hypothetical protein